MASSSGDTSPPRVAPPPPKLDDFPFRTHDKLRYRDSDQQGHINNAIFSTFLETGRVEFLFAPDLPLTAEHGGFAIAHLSLDFKAEMHWPGQIDIGTGVQALGKRSITLFQALFQEGICVATAKTIIVHMDMTTRKSAPLTAQARAFLTQHMLA